jgi:hypothetical protein
MNRDNHEIHASIVWCEPSPDETHLIRGNIISTPITLAGRENNLSGWQDRDDPANLIKIVARFA